MLDIINTNISFFEFYMSSTPVFVYSRYRHSLHVIEMQLPLNIRKKYEMSKDMNWYYYGGALLRYIPYAYGFVNNQEGTLINKGHLYMKIEDFPFSPNIGIGIEILKNNKNLFTELNYQYSIGNYFYGGNRDYRIWQCDQLIDFRHFILLKIGLKI